MAPTKTLSPEEKEKRKKKRQESRKKVQEKRKKEQDEAFDKLVGVPNQHEGTVEKAKETDSRSERQKMMDAILNDHYDQKEKVVPTLATYRTDTNLECTECNYIASSAWRLKTHMKCHQRQFQPLSDGLEPTEPEFFLDIPSSQGSRCILNGTHQRPEPYVLVEILHPEKPKEESHCHFFVPEMLYESILHNKKDWSGSRFPLQPISEHTFHASFESAEHTIKWPTTNAAAMKAVRDREMFILTKSRFKLVQNSLKSNLNGTKVFCQFVDDQHLTRIYKEEKAQPIDIPKMPFFELAVFNCPVLTCKHVSEKKFTGIRTHMLHHFKTEIKALALPRAQLSEREKKRCMAATSCSVTNLEKRGDLIHHFGIFHGIVDELFQNYGLSWLKSHYPECYQLMKCPYDDVFCKDDSGLVEHLTIHHYYNLILGEVENMVMFKLTYEEEKRTMFNVFKCPYCLMRFTNHENAPDPKDIKLLVIHCGIAHGFSLYYIMADRQIAEYRKLLVKQEIKEELFDAEDEGNIVDHRPDIKDPDIKPDVLINNDENDEDYKPTEDDFIRIQEEPPGLHMENSSDANASVFEDSPMNFKKIKLSM